MFCDLNDALNWIMSAHKGKMSFDRFKKICDSIGNPQDRLNIIHVAGTNGKGSTVTFLRDLLISQGYTVGSLQSPHYLTHLDRIRLNGENINENIFLEILNNNYDFFVANNLGMFEMDYLIMCEYFIREKVDFVIVEVGIGGRLDSTNVVSKPLLSIITNIGLDHMELLGDNLESICREKCGIIKRGCPVLIGNFSKELEKIVENIALRNNSKLYFVKNYIDLGQKKFMYDGVSYALFSLANYQKANASLALEAFRIISDLKGFKIDIDKAKIALENSVWKGRFDIVLDKPRVILDGAHNPHGIRALVSTFDELNGSKCVIFSALKRKDYLKMCEILKEHTNKLIVTKFDYQGSLDLKDLDVENKDEDYKHAILSSLNEFDNILICGSLYFISEVAEQIGGIFNKWQMTK